MAARKAGLPHQRQPAASSTQQQHPAASSTQRQQPPASPAYRMSLSASIHPLPLRFTLKAKRREPELMAPGPPLQGEGGQERLWMFLRQQRRATHRSGAEKCRLEAPAAATASNLL